KHPKPIPFAPQTRILPTQRSRKRHTGFSRLSVPFPQAFHFFEVIFHRLEQYFREERYPILVSLTRPNNDSLLAEIHILRSQTQAFLQPKPRAVEQACHEGIRPIQSRYNRPDLVAGTDNRQTPPRLGPQNRSESLNRHSQYRAKKNQQCVE